jgi:hypothetical protein
MRGGWLGCTGLDYLLTIKLEPWWSWIFASGTPPQVSSSSCLVLKIMVLCVVSSEKYGEGIVEDSLWIFYISCEIYMLRLCSFSCVDRFMFKLWALCVQKRHQQDSELELAYLWYVLLKVVLIKENAKMSKLGSLCGDPTHCGLHGFKFDGRCESSSLSPIWCTWFGWVIKPELCSPNRSQYVSSWTWIPSLFMAMSKYYSACKSKISFSLNMWLSDLKCIVTALNICLHYLKTYLSWSVSCLPFHVPSIFNWELAETSCAGFGDFFGVQNSHKHGVYFIFEKMMIYCTSHILMSWW